MDFQKAIKQLARLTTVMFVLVLGFFGAVILYQLKPSLFYTHQAETDLTDWFPPAIDTDLPEDERGRQIRYGYLLLTETSKWMGPQVKNPDMQYAGNNLACKNCHLNAGKQAGSASWIGVTERYPQFRARENKVGTIEDRINGCMERSVNGRKLPENSKQMKAIVAYMEWLSEGIPQEKVYAFSGFPDIKLPELAADPAIGKSVYERECMLCHGKNGEGVWLADSSKGYQFPPLWGPDSYNHGAGMNRVITAAEFIKANMPFGQASHDKPKLSDEEAYHVAAYIDSFERPLKENAEADFPDIQLKHVSTPYGPWADDFPAEQHKYGPFGPIMRYYKDKYDITKTK
ncbi:thiosulfate dehydrogenase [Catalinimonas alkaloidigena]|uniref:c-type cytochrome n=1 Tax=Catalinimonas alkaloidigena TaxID=1075417 RepID=UPI002405832B|nr:c-type cytochrome [Catalinimonas alkaloidigena]MDF9798812.1 thiosulfate dehydrogenase [Catalinimonas alkaloidigena]